MCEAVFTFFIIGGISILGSCLFDLPGLYVGCIAAATSCIVYAIIVSKKI